MSKGYYHDHPVSIVEIWINKSVVGSGVNPDVYVG